MKGNQTYTPQVDKIRRDLGKFSEKVDKKFALTSNSMSRKTTHSLVDRAFNTKITNNNKKIGKSAYVLLFIILVLSILFLFMLVTLIINIKHDEI